MGTKECRKCKCLKPLDNFHKKSTTEDGYNNICKNCLKQQIWLRKIKEEKVFDIPLDYLEERIKFDNIFENDETIKHNKKIFQERNIKKEFSNIEKIWFFYSRWFDVKKLIKIYPSEYGYLSILDKIKAYY